MSEWLSYTIGELAAHAKSALATGPFGSAVSSKNFRSSGVPMLRGSNLTEDVGTRLNETDLVHLDPVLAETFSRSTARRGDLIFTCWGSVGQIGLIDASSQYESYIVSNKQMKLTPNSEIVDSTFLYYYLSQPTMVFEVQSRAIGSTIPGFNLGQLRSLRVNLPTVDVQRAIAEVLGVLDDKIAANTKLARTSMALSEAHFRQLLADTTELSTLGELLTLEYGKALPASLRRQGPAVVYGSGGVVGSHDQALKSGPGIIVGRKGSAGVVHWSPDAFFPIDTTYYVDPKFGDESLTFCYHMLKSLKLSEMNSDSAVPGLNRNEAHATKVQRISRASIQSFGALTRPLFAQAAQYDKENTILAATRDTLLPQLMSGKLRVKDIENTMGEMV